MVQLKEGDGMKGKNQPLLEDEPVEVEKSLVKLQNFGTISGHYRRMYNTVVAGD